MSLKPRDYQQAANDHVWSYFMNGGKGNPLIVMPTGTGKSLVLALLASTMVRAYPATRILVLTHVKELIKNNHDTLLRLWPGAPAGIYSAGLGRRDLHAQITFAGIASIAGRVRYFGKTDIILIDEAHRVSDDEASTYVKFISGIRAQNPHLKVIGLTATDYRLGMGKLTEGELFDDVVFDLSSGEAFLWMLDQGYLAPLKPKAPTVQIDTSEVSTARGEFVQRQLAAAIKEQGIIDAALLEAAHVAEDRKRWLVFATSIEQTEEIAEKLNVLGIKATFVHSKISAKERDKRVADFQAGAYQAMVNKDILTTGFDCPEIDCIVSLRPTQSPGLWVQMLGRGTRPVYAPGFDLTTAEGRLAAQRAGPKQDCLVLDFAMNTMRLGPINYPTIPKKKGPGTGEAPVKVCPQCCAIVPISTRVCAEEYTHPDTRAKGPCGHVFPIEDKLQHQASSIEIIRREPVKPQVADFAVTRMIGTRHIKPGKPDSVRVDYHCGVRRFTVWVGVEHPGWAGSRAREWWRLHAPRSGDPMPKTTAQLLGVFDTLRMPTKIKVALGGKYPEVLEYDFTRTPVKEAS